jgi:hypothetical protein
VGSRNVTTVMRAIGRTIPVVTALALIAGCASGCSAISASRSMAARAAGSVLLSSRKPPVTTHSTLPAAPTKTMVGGRSKNRVGVHGVTLGRFLDPEAYAAERWLYVSEATLDSPRSGRNRLLRLNPRTGTIDASLLLGSTDAAMLLFQRTLWILTTPPAALNRGGRAASHLVALNPVNLAVKGRLSLPPGGPFGRTLVEAAGWIWIADSAGLVRVSPTTMAVTAIVPLSGASASVTTNRRGSTLIVGEGFSGGEARLQRRNSSNGRLLAETAKTFWVGAPTLSPVVDHGVWVSYATGLQGGIERLDATTLKRTRTRLDFTRASNGVIAAVGAGHLFVNQAGGGELHNFCGNEITGQPEAGLVVDARILTAGAHQLYIAVSDSDRAALQTVERVSIRPGCA